MHWGYPDVTLPMVPYLSDWSLLTYSFQVPFLGFELSLFIYVLRLYNVLSSLTYIFLELQPYFTTCRYLFTKYFAIIFQLCLEYSDFLLFPWLSFTKFNTIPVTCFSWVHLLCIPVKKKKPEHTGVGIDHPCNRFRLFCI